MEPTYEQLKKLYEWLRGEVGTSIAYYTPGGLKVSRNHWMTPRVSGDIARAMRALDILNETNDFPQTYCKLCNGYYPYGLYNVEGLQLCGKCNLEFTWPPKR